VPGTPGEWDWRVRAAQAQELSARFEPEPVAQFLAAAQARLEATSEAGLCAESAPVDIRGAVAGPRHGCPTAASPCHRASADPGGKPGRGRKAYVWRAEPAGQRAGYDVPDFPAGHRAVLLSRARHRRPGGWPTAAWRSGDGRESFLSPAAARRGVCQHSSQRPGRAGPGGQRVPLPDVPEPDLPSPLHPRRWRGRVPVSGAPSRVAGRHARKR